MVNLPRNSLPAGEPTNTLSIEYDIDNRVAKEALQAFPEHMPEMSPEKATIQVDTSDVIGKIGSHFVGYNLEDLNHQLFPGLYAQMLSDESFEDEPMIELPDGWEWHAEPLNQDTPTDPHLLHKWRGAWSIEDGVLTLVGSRQRRIYTNQVQLGNGYVECEVFQPSSDRSFYGPGILACWQPTSYYYISAVPERKLVFVGKGTNPAFVQSAEVIGSATVDVRYDQWHRLAARFYNGHISVCLDGVVVIECDDHLPLSGGIGLEASFTRSCFRSLSVVPEGMELWRAGFSLSDRGYIAEEHISRWWTQVSSGSSEARFAWVKENPYNTDRCQMISMQGGNGSVGLYNAGLHGSGLCFRNGWVYSGRLYLRGDDHVEVTLSLQNRDGTRTYGVQRIIGVEKQWKRFDIEIPSNADDTNGRFCISIDCIGRVFVDQVTLLPDPRGMLENVPVRRDIAEAIRDSSVTHIRFGGDMVNSWGFDWHEMRKPLDVRRQYLDGWNYHKSAQFMIFEFLEFAQAIGVEPIINFGEHLSAEDIAEFVEYCNGNELSKWGKARVSSGRTQPYELKYIMYGNGMPPLDQVERAIQLVHAVDPSIQFICGDVGHLPWTLMSERRPDDALRLNGLARGIQVLGSRPELSFLSSHLVWQDLIEKATVDFPALTTGTMLYAEEVNGAAYNWQRGLDNALFAITSENHANVVWGQSYCNLLQANGHLYEWNQGHIHFTSSEVWLQPAGWAVKMVAENILPNVIATRVESPSLVLEKRSPGEPIPVETSAVVCSASKSGDGKSLVLKVVNIWGGDVSAYITLHGARVRAATATVLASRHLAGENTIQDKHYIAPKIRQVKDPSTQIGIKLPPCSFTVLRIEVN